MEGSNLGGRIPICIEKEKYGYLWNLKLSRGDCLAKHEVNLKLVTAQDGLGNQWMGSWLWTKSRGTRTDTRHCKTEKKPQTDDILVRRS